MSEQTEEQETPSPQIVYSAESVDAAVGTRLRAESAPLPEYLFSRSRAGATARDLVRAISQGFGEQLYSRFFPTHPRRRLRLSSWLQRWLRRGAVPIVTINPQRAPLRPGQSVPDAWHHQMVFGVGPAGVYLTNPLQCVQEAVLARQVVSVRSCFSLTFSILPKSEFLKEKVETHSGNGKSNGKNSQKIQS